MSDASFIAKLNAGVKKCVPLSVTLTSGFNILVKMFLRILPWFEW